jgi:hypothetical protein
MRARDSEYLLDGSMGAAGLRESGGTAPCTASFWRTRPGESWTVKFVLEITHFVNILALSLPCISKRQGDAHGQFSCSDLVGDPPRDKTSPCFVAFVDNLDGVFLVFSFARECECVFELPVGNFVDPCGRNRLARSARKARKKRRT